MGFPKPKNKFFSSDEYSELKRWSNMLSDSLIFFAPLPKSEKKRVAIVCGISALAAFVIISILAIAISNIPPISFSSLMLLITIAICCAVVFCCIAAVTLLKKKTKHELTTSPLYIFENDALWQLTFDEIDISSLNKLNTKQNNFLRINTSHVVSSMSNETIAIALYFLKAIDEWEIGNDVKGISIAKIDSIEDMLQTKTEDDIIWDVACEVDGEPTAFELKASKGDTELAMWLANEMEFEFE